LFRHANGTWAKKVLGKQEHFGSWKTDPTGAAALALWLDQKDDLLAGRRPTTATGKATVRDLLNRFRATKLALLESGEIVAGTYADWCEICDMVKDAISVTRTVDSLGPEDFEHLRIKLGRGRGPVTVGNLIQRARCLFKYAYDAALIDAPVRFGPGFKRPTRKVLRIERQRRGPRLFSREEIVAILDAANVQMKAMVLLSLNCAYGPTDLGRLRIDAVNFRTGWVHHARPKTGIDRRCPLWPETIKAVKAVLAERKAPANPDHAPFLFITKYGGTWFRKSGDNAVSSEFAKLLASLGLAGQTGRGLYRLRHLHATIGSAVRDPEASRALMGHAADSNDMSAVYVEAIDDDRLRRVTDHIREWLYPGPQKRRAK